jgi:hypothetical protein
LIFPDLRQSNSLGLVTFDHFVFFPAPLPLNLAVSGLIYPDLVQDNSSRRSLGEGGTCRAEALGEDGIWFDLL